MCILMDTFNVFCIVLASVQFFSVNSFPMMYEVRSKRVAKIHDVLISFGNFDQLFEREDSFVEMSREKLLD